MNGASGNGWYRSLLPRFLQKDYSPYQCRVSANRENYDLRARRIHLQNMLKTWFNTGRNPFVRPVECRHCLFDTRVPNIYIGPDGLCNMCMTYRRNFKPAVLAAEIRDFMNTRREAGASVDAVVAFSGGKDSTASLCLARQTFKLTITAVLIDNGFIPRAVIDNGRRFCDRMETELTILPVNLAARVRELMRDDFKSGYPCYRCTELFHERIRQYCTEHRINRVILGRNWWRWLEPEVRSIRRVRDEATGMDIQFISLPFALQLNEEAVRLILAEQGWRAVDIHGNSTNCLIPGMVEYTLYRRLGYHPELNLLSREVISGYLEKEEARKQLRDIRDFSAELRGAVEAKLRDPAAPERRV